MLQKVTKAKPYFSDPITYEITGFDLIRQITAICQVSMPSTWEYFRN